MLHPWATKTAITLTREDWVLECLASGSSEFFGCCGVRGWSLCWPEQWGGSIQSFGFFLFFLLMVLAIQQWQFLSTKGNAQQTFWEGTFVPCVYRTVHGRIYSPRILQLNRHLALPRQQHNQLLLLRWGKKSKLCWRKGSNSSHSKDPQLLFHYFERALWAMR